MRRERWLALGVLGAMALGSTGCGSWKRGGFVTDRMACWFKDGCAVQVPCESVRHDWPASEADAEIASQAAAGIPMLQGRFLMEDGSTPPKSSMDVLLFDVHSLPLQEVFMGCSAGGWVQLSEDGYFRTVSSKRTVGYYLGVMHRTGGKSFHPMELIFLKDACVEIQLAPYKR
ncbi:hypothetical protein D7V88_24235 [Corallococcus terminator]|uniref:Lipoprotein n=2 Tax=Corallococcus terminator TaxID=2316733 RepID=A0A3A8IJA9_9BACT|nr:hypothetical protein D7V88_24235 [Corallococcus terminator]